MSEFLFASKHNSDVFTTTVTLQRWPESGLGWADVTGSTIRHFGNSGWGA